MNKKRIFALAGLLSLLLVGAFFVSSALADSSTEAADCQKAIRLLGKYDEGSYWDADTETCMLRYEYPEFTNTCYPSYDQNKVVYRLGDEDPIASLKYMGCTQ